MSSAEKFLKLLEQKGLVPKEVLQRLRRQVASSTKPISPQTLAKQLVQAGHLTSSQAQRLVEQLRESLGVESAPEETGGHPTSPMPEPPPSGDAFTSFLEEELGLAQLEEDRARRPSQPTAPAAPSQPKPTAGAKPGVPSGGEKPPGKPVEQAAAKASKPSAPAPKGPPSKTPAKPEAEKPSPDQVPSKKRPPGKPSRPSTESPSSLGSLLEEELGALEPMAAGPGDLDTLLAGSAAETAAPLSPLAPVAARRGFWSRLFGRAARPSARRRWDSPLILVGSGALVILVLVGIVLLWVFRRESGDLLLEAAHKDFADGAYTQAIFKYNQFLDRFSGHPAASLARVRRGVAQLRQVVEEGRDWTKAFQTAQQVLEEIAGEEEFREAHVHLSSLLPKIAQGLAAEAEKQANSALLPLAHQALGWLDRYVPGSLRNQMEVDEIQGQIGQLARRFNEQAETEKTVSAIREAIQAERPAEGYRLARSHLRQYPEAAKRVGFQQALQELKDSFQKQLRRWEPNRPSQTEEPSSPIQRELGVAASTGGAIAGLEQQIVVICFDGSLYGLEAATGRLLWRRWIGPVTTGRAPEPQPLPVSSDSQSDLIVPGGGRKELWRLERATGRVRWRNLLPGPLAAPPVIAREFVLAISELPDDRSRLEWIDLEKGTTVLAVDLPQKVEVAPAVDMRQDRIYLVGEHSYLWMFSFSDGQCLGVIGLDHAPGTITATPLVVADWLLVAENHRLDQASVKLIAVGQKEQTSSPVVFQEEIAGHVDTQPVAADRRVVVLTDRGTIRVYEIQTAGGRTPLARVAQRGPEGAANLVRFGLLVDRELWVAGAGLDRFEVHSAQGRLEFRPLDDPETGDIFLQPPICLEKALVHVRYRPGIPGAWAAAVDPKTGRRLWQTHLAVPPAGEPIRQPDSEGNLWVIRQTGEIFALDLAAGKCQLLAPLPPVALPKPSSVADSSEPRELHGRVLVMGGSDLLFLFSPPTDRWFLLEKKTAAAEWKTVALPGPLANWPTPFANGLLVPTQTGRIELRHPHSGEELMAPFQPPLEPGRMPAWGQPVVISSQATAPARAQQEPAQQPPESTKPLADSAKEKQSPSVRNEQTGDGEFLVSDGLGRIYRVGVAKSPKPHLKCLGWVDFRGRVGSPVAVVGQTAWLVVEPARTEPSSGPSFRLTSPSKQKEDPKTSMGSASPTSEQKDTSAMAVSSKQSIPTVSLPSASSASGEEPPNAGSSESKAFGSAQQAQSLGGESAGANQRAPNPKQSSALGDVSGGKPAGSGQEASKDEASEDKLGSKPAGPASRLVRLALPSLERTEVAMLEGRCIWGPVAVGEWMLLATDAGQYLVADSQGQLLAKLKGQTDRPVGTALSWEGGILAACRTGRVVWLRPDEKGWKIDTLVHIHRPLASGPVIVEDQLLLLGHDGTVYALSLQALSKQKTMAETSSSSPRPEPPRSDTAPSESERPKSPDASQAKSPKS
ncbi:MAG: PQQ-binding-like beta-propeller repeat protein [Thermoguttaceae bacterium]|nr:PQQ-binding-like beta-propeller repeat protein [Thermoguttaceae bacterium]MDW8036732.1 PQQ-binding-like beta-propeller repeat protein [Thermoguttaceae bacterium]